MQANLARRNRRIPITCLLLLLLSTLINAIGTPSYSVAPSLWKLIEQSLSFYELIETVISSLAYNAVSIPAIFFVLIVFTLLFKPKGWVIAILSTLASIFMLTAGTVVAIMSVKSFVFLVTNGMDSELLINVVDIIVNLLPILTSVSWFALGLAGASATILHKTARKAIRYSFGAITIAFGIIASSMFVISSVGNLLAALKEIIYFLILGINKGFNACTLAPIFILANVIGFIGIIMLTVYLVWPYKKKYQPEETDPEIIYAIDENDPVMREIGGTAPEKTDCDEVEESADTYAEDTSEAVDGEPLEKKKSLFKKLKELGAKRSRAFKTSYILLIVSLILEFGAFIPGVAIVSLIVMPRIKNKTTMVIYGIMNMVLGGGILSLTAGIFMIFIPECSLCCEEVSAPTEENVEITENNT